MIRLLICLLILCFSFNSFAAPAALQVESSISGYLDNSGKILANGKIEFFTSDAYSTYKAVYSDAAKTTVLSQPISLNSSGIPVNGSGTPVAIFADGVYWMRLKSSAGLVIRSYRSVTYQGAIDFGGLYIDIASTYGRTDTAITNALADYGGSSSQVTFLFNSGEFLNSSARTLPSNVKFLFVNGAYLTNSGALIAPNIWEFQSNSYVSNSSTISFTNGANLIDTLGSTLQGSGAYTGNFRAPMFATNEVYVPGQYASVNLAIAAINKSTGVSWNIVLVGDSPLTTTVSIPVNVKKITSRSGYLTGVGQITFTGQYLDCPPNEHLFRGSVSVTGNITNPEVYPEWFGAKGDGFSDDQLSINKTFSLIKNNGGTIVFKKETYITNGYCGLLSGGKNIKVISTNKSKLKKGVLFPNDEYILRFTLVDSVDVSGIILIGSTPIPSYGYGTGDHGLGFFSCSNIHVSRCKFTELGDGALKICDSLYTSQFLSKNSIVEDNIFYRIGQTSTTSTGTSIYTFRNNSFEYCGAAKFATRNTKQNTIIIDGNTINNSFYNGIEIVSYSKVKVINNFIYNCINNAVDFSVNQEVTTGPVLPITDIHIAGNVISTCNVGIRFANEKFISPSIGVQARNISIEGNSISNSLSPTFSAISVSSGGYENLKIIGNHINTFSGDGLSVSLVTNYDIASSNVVISKNDVKNGLKKALVISSSGSKKASNVIISENFFKTLFGSACSVSNLSNVLVLHNIFNSSTLMDFASILDGEISNNIFLGSHGFNLYSACDSISISNNLFYVSGTFLRLDTGNTNIKYYDNNEKTGTITTNSDFYFRRMGTVTPNGTIRATQGSMYIKTNGRASTCLWVKETPTGNIGWVAK